MRKVKVFRFPMGGPDDASGLDRLITEGHLKPEEIICILGKTEGNGCVNDFTRGFATLSFKLYLSEKLKISREEVTRKVAFIMSGGTEGVMCPHATVFAITNVNEQAKPGKRLTVGTAFTRDFKPEEIGRMPQVEEVARCVQEAMADAGITDARDVHFVQIKCPLLDSGAILDAHTRGETVATSDTYKSMAYSRGASALGTAVAIGELRREQINNEVICKDWSLYSGVASTSAGIELKKCEIILMGNAEGVASDLMVGHAVMQDPIDMDAILTAMKGAGLKFETLPSDAELGKIINIFAKAEAASNGKVRGRRNPMIDESDIPHTRMARAVVNAVISALWKDPMNYVSGGGEHQGPDGGGPVAVIAQA